MATLNSPGVSITVSDESFYASAGTGTVPLIVVATAENKASPDGSGIAAYTTPDQAGELKLIASQRELLQNYGNPVFHTAGGSQLHGYELNEYGLLAAHSFLGAANRAFVLRADVDLAELEPRTVAPTGELADGTYWLDLDTTAFGLKEWNGTSWVTQTVRVVEASNVDSGTGAPKQSFGSSGDYAVVAVDAAGDGTGTLVYWGKKSGAWIQVGSSPAWDAHGNVYFAPHTSLPSTSGLSSGDVLIQTTSPNQGASIVVKEYDSATAQFTTVSAPVYASTTAAYADDSAPAVGDLIAVYGDLSLEEATFSLRRHNGEADLTVIGSDFGNVAIGSTISITVDSTSVTVTTTDTASSGGVTLPEDLVLDINAALDAEANITGLEASLNSDGGVTLVHSDGLDVTITSGTIGADDVGLSTSADVTFSNYEVFDLEAGVSMPTGTIAAGTLWYDTTVSAAKTDLLVNDGSTWNTFTGELLVTATEPTTRASGGGLQAGDIWLDGGDLENFPVLYRYSGSAWVLVDKTDQVTEDGVVFGDFRASSSSSLDADAPQPTLYPVGILGWNKRASSMSVKRWEPGYVHQGVLIGDRWVDASGNSSDGSMYGGRKAVRAVIKQAMQSAIASNDNLRSEQNAFNLIAAPGFPELADEMITLSVDRKDTAFVIIDTPFRLAGDATSVTNWATNANNAVENGEDGLLSSSPYAATYYPSGLSTNLDGSSVVVPASHMALRTLAYNDQIAFPWFAPAGYQRGIVNNASNVGYVDAATGEFIPVSLNEGQRDALYLNKVNPITLFPGQGIVVFGQKTLNPVSSALDRVNVARLMVVIRERLDDIVRPFLFEPNDDVTRSNVKTVVDGFLSGLVTQRGLFDFVTVCDTSNNTPARIDRNELYIDVAIQPTKAVEFIYIPIRIQNTLGQTG